MSVSVRAEFSLSEVRENADGSFSLEEDNSHEDDYGQTYLRVTTGEYDDELRSPLRF